MREVMNMNQGWLFHLGEISYDELNGHYATYMHAKAQSGRGAAQELFYDEDFRKVNLPHDYVIEQEPSQRYNEAQGGYFRDNAWYRKHFQLPVSDEGRRIVILFDGVGRKTEVWVNGQPAGKNDSMYNSFYMDITPYLHYGEEDNVIAVHIQNEDDAEGWWYEGAGIYRNVWMIKTSVTSMDVWGLRIRPHKIKESLWKVGMDIDLYHMEKPQNVKIICTLRDENGQDTMSVSSTVLAQFGRNNYTMELVVNDPHLWNLDYSVLYEMVADVWVDGVLEDSVKEKFGFRVAHFDPDSGFHLNGKPIKIRGVCIHQDHARLGVAVPANVLEFRLQQLKRAGVNAYRCAHHNPAPELLDLCDKMGILVLDENRWFNCSEETLKQVRFMCCRDMNHPSVILWSIGNEEPLQSTKMGRELVRQLREFVRRIDPLRPVTIALNGGFYNSYAATESDVVGINYRISEYKKMHEIHKGKAIIATESGASDNDRGVYFEPESDQVSKGIRHDYSTAYDKKTTSFGSSYREAIREAETHSFIAGTFLWSGISYRGEAAWPMTSSGSGILDNCAIEKDNFYMVKSIWNSEPMIHIMPSWNLHGHNGEEVEVWIYTNQEETELIINGQTLGRKKAERFEPIIYSVYYQPGNIEAIGYSNGKEVVRECLNTAGAPEQLQVQVLNDATDSGEDAYVININLADANSYELTDSDAKITCDVLRGGSLLSLDSGDPKDTSSSFATERKLFSGKLQAIVKVDEFASDVMVNFSCKQYQLKKSIHLTPKKAVATHRLAVFESGLELREFRKWPDALEKNAIDATYNFHDMNTSEPAIMHHCRGEQGEGYEIYTGKTVIPMISNKKTIYLKFENLVGDVEIRVFHDHDCWPNPVPAEYLDKKEHFILEKKMDCIIELEGFHAKEKVNIILLVKRDGKFALDRILYSVKEK